MRFDVSVDGIGEIPFRTGPHPSREPQNDDANLLMKRVQVKRSELHLVPSKWSKSFTRYELVRVDHTAGYELRFEK